MCNIIRILREYGHKLARANIRGLLAPTSYTTKMDSDLEGEKHEVEPFEATVFTTSRSIRNPISRGVHCCLIVPLVLILAFAISSLSYFAVTHEKIGDIKHVNGHGRCILFADYNEDIQNIDLSSGHACVFSIFGEVAVAVLACLLIIWMIIKTSAGFHMLVTA